MDGQDLYKFIGVYPCPSVVQNNDRSGVLGHSYASCLCHPFSRLIFFLDPMDQFLMDLIKSAIAEDDDHIVFS